MELMLWLVPASIGLTLLAVAAFIWAVRRGQFDRLDHHALDILEDFPPRAPVRPAPPESGLHGAPARTHSDHIGERS